MLITGGARRGHEVRRDAGGQQHTRQADQEGVYGGTDCVRDNNTKWRVVNAGGGDGYFVGGSCDDDVFCLCAICVFSFLSVSVVAPLWSLLRVIGFLVFWLEYMCLAKPCRLYARRGRWLTFVKPFLFNVSLRCTHLHYVMRYYSNGDGDGHPVYQSFNYATSSLFCFVLCHWR